MSSDQAQPRPLPHGHRPDWELPAITEVAIQRMPFAPREPRNFRSPLASAPDACEIVVTLAAPLPIRAMGPVLHVGNTQLTESEALDREGRRIRFWAVEPGVLKKGAPISLAWGGNEDKTRAVRSKFTFSLPE
jgi:hypothetical protein